MKCWPGGPRGLPPPGKATPGSRHRPKPKAQASLPPKPDTPTTNNRTRTPEESPRASSISPSSFSGQWRRHLLQHRYHGGGLIAIERCLLCARRAATTAACHLRCKAASAEVHHGSIPTLPSARSSSTAWSACRVLAAVKTSTPRWRRHDGTVWPEAHRTIATLANVITLVGLLGTIIGLIIFQLPWSAAVSLPRRSSCFSASISITAMNNTVFALSVAIPFLLDPRLPASPHD